jgi:hypothetical protein
MTRAGFNISWLLSNPTPQQQCPLLPNVKTYTEGGRRITFEELSCFKLGYNLGFVELCFNDKNDLVTCPVLVMKVAWRKFTEI